MKRRYTSQDFNPVDYLELSKKTAIHEAGHAAAIYFGNKAKQLPPIFFQIIMGDCSRKTYNTCTTKLEGGRLIETLPYSIDNLSFAQKQAYQQAFEADVINLLIGSLAEANYVAQRDNELISPRLIPPTALKNYGGESDLESIHEYLDCFIADKAQQEKKLNELFRAAFDFVNNSAHWLAITGLANHILVNNQNIIGYEEVAAVLDAHFVTIKKRTWCL